MTNKLSDLELERIKKLLQKGDKDGATALYRDLTKAGIFETKDAIKALEDEWNISSEKPKSVVSSTDAIFDENGFLVAEEAVFDDVSDIRMLCLRGDKIKAIRLYCQRKGVSLQEGKMAVEAMCAADQRTSISDESIFTSPQTIDELICAGKKNEAIKMFMAQHMASLAEATRMIADREAELFANSPEKFIGARKALAANNLSIQPHNSKLQNTGPGFVFILSMVALVIALGIWYFLLIKS